MEKIYKLLQSINKEDVAIGFLLLLKESPKDILGLFKKTCRYEDGAYDFITKISFDKNPIPKGTYICIGNGWRFVNSNGNIRLRDINSYDYIQYHRVITKEQYLNGMY